MFILLMLRVLPLLALIDLVTAVSNGGYHALLLDRCIRTDTLSGAGVSILGTLDHSTLLSSFLTNENTVRSPLSLSIEEK